MDTTARTGSQVPRFGDSNIYPQDRKLIAELAADMSVNGFDANFPILTKEIDGTQHIVDGWHRYKASEMAKVQPTFVEFTGSSDDALRAVLRANGNRRHLTDQQKLAAALLVNVRLKGTPQSAEDISKHSGLAVGTVNRYRTYTPEELECIVGGRTARQMEEARKESTGKGKRSKKAKPVTYDVTSKEQRRLGGLSASTGKSVMVLFKEIVVNGLDAMEQELDKDSNGATG